MRSLLVIMSLLFLVSCASSNNRVTYEEPVKQGLTPQEEIELAELEKWFNSLPIEEQNRLKIDHQEKQIAQLLAEKEAREQKERDHKAKEQHRIPVKEVWEVISRVINPF
jgi:hypothetical protein